MVYFNSGKFEQDINSASPLKGKLACCFGELVRDIFSMSSGNSFSPSRFKKEVSLNGSFFTLLYHLTTVLLS